MKIGATISPSLLSLLDKNQIDVDYIEVNGERDLATLQQALAYRPVLLHDLSNEYWLNYAEPFDEATLTRARTMLDMAQSPWLSTGIGASAEPQGHTTEFWRGAPASALQSRELCIANIVRNGRRLMAWSPVPLLLENYNYHPTNAYEYVCEPATFSELIAAIGCGMLLDLAHAQISAFNMGWADPRAYLEQLPLDKVREIHINHPYNDDGNPVLPRSAGQTASQSTQGVQMLDRHGSIQTSDVELLSWTLARTPHAEAITLESESPSEEALVEEVRLVRMVVR
jgi:uncharacterized protein (UPF0276 family)